MDVNNKELKFGYLRVNWVSVKKIKRGCVNMQVVVNRTGCPTMRVISFRAPGSLHKYALGGRKSQGQIVALFATRGFYNHSFAQLCVTFD